jgi:hypothetical protein
MQDQGPRALKYQVLLLICAVRPRDVGHEHPHGAIFGIQQTYIRP